MRRDLFFPLISASIFSFLIFLYLGYVSYKNYISYKVLQDSDSYVSTLYNIDNLLGSIENERMLSAKYLGSEGKISFEELKRARKQSDMMLDRFDKFTKDNSQFKKDLIYARSKVDILSDNIKEIFDEYYQKLLSQKLLGMMKKSIEQLSNIEGLKSSLDPYERIVEYKNRLNKESSFVAYFSYKKQKATDDELAILDEALMQIEPPFDIKQKDDFLMKVKLITKVVLGDCNFSYEDWRKRETPLLSLAHQMKKESFLKGERFLSGVKIDPNFLIYKVFASIIFLFLSLFLFRKSFEFKPKRSTSNKGSYNFDVTLGSVDISSPNKASDYDGDEIVLKQSIKERDDESLNIQPTALRTLNPLQKFKNIASILLKESKERDFELRYEIDEDIPKQVFANVSTMDKILHIVLDDTLHSAKSSDLIEFWAENIAQSKVGYTIRVKFIHQTIDKESDDINIHKLKSLAHSIGSTFDVDYLDKSRFIKISFNLKK
jgi:archaellum component FlaC